MEGQPYLCDSTEKNFFFEFPLFIVFSQERGDITRWREDMTFTLERQTIFYERVQRVKYCFWREKINFFSLENQRNKILYPGVSSSVRFD